MGLALKHLISYSYGVKIYQNPYCGSEVETDAIPLIWVQYTRRAKNP
jgi:hypothetical protein